MTLESNINYYIDKIFPNVFPKKITISDSDYTISSIDIFFVLLIILVFIVYMVFKKISSKKKVLTYPYQKSSYQGVPYQVPSYQRQQIPMYYPPYPRYY